MASKARKVPESSGKFRKDVYERTVKIVGAFTPAEITYRAFGDDTDTPRRVPTTREKTIRELSKHDQN